MSHIKPLQTELTKIFFDESGQGSGSERPATMGGLLMPNKIYDSSDFDDLNKALQEKTIKLHWTEYTGDIKMRQDILDVINLFSKYASLCRMNVISYNTSTLESRYKLSNHAGSFKKKKRDKKALNYATLMIYTKIPERIFYGLLRHFGKDVYIKTDIFIEKEGKYEKYDLEKRLEENLNTQSLYRAQQYWVNNCKMVPKQEMIGVELVDLLLGIIRLILINPPIPLGLTDEEYKEKKIKGQAKKHQLVIELLKEPKFYDFLSNLSYYEWDSDRQLLEISFKDYLDLFINSNYKEFI
ncbi:DUF3800 domain-containing protein [Gracilibacillus sp. YIM 98692]|uniref:DUF3800 domain-containing protein n=1 Tax=Gracilibacillus sp. YIM 98692 TaxID=2663532 RepID=UPI0013D6DD36|nr:DUF3800 domain-containing protein [Gracilibacillus sp. YIM 98692]